MKKAINDILVIGGNSAGPSAAAKAKRINPNAKVKLFEASDFISTGSCEIPYLFSGQVDNFEKLIFFNKKSFQESKGCEVFTNSLVTEIDRNYKCIFVKDLKNNSVNEHFYDKLILATGSVSNKLSELPSDLRNVYYLKTIGDYRNIQKFFSKNEIKTALIIGAGYIGLELADNLSSKINRVILADKQSHPLESSEREISSLILDKLKQNNIEFLAEYGSNNFIIENNFIKTIKHQGLFIDVDIVIISTGFKPNTNLAQTAGLKLLENNSIQVDNRLRTSDANIYAVGDCISYLNKITRKKEFMPLAKFAYSSGHIAGENAAGGNKFMNPVIKNISVKIFDNFYSQVGLTAKQAIDVGISTHSVHVIANNKVSVMPNSSKVFGKLVFDSKSKTILGASFFGGSEVSGYSDIISTLINSNEKIERLHEINYNYTPPLSPFINILSLLGKKALE